jgi:hypothetical protein
VLVNAVERYHAALENIPAPGGGCHCALLRVANYGVMAKRDPQQLHDEIRHAIPPGDRHVPDREIDDAIEKALADYRGGTFVPRPKPQPIVQDGKAALERILNQAEITDEATVWDNSPIRVSGEPREDMVLLLSTFYESTDLVFIGERHDAGVVGSTIRTVAEWVAYFRAGGRTWPHIIPNPLDGIPRPKKTGDGMTLRGDANVATYRFAVVEFDTLSRAEQLRFWAAIQLPILVLIDSGGKSIHGWLDVQQLAPVQTAEAWAEHIKRQLYDALLTPLGVDGACSNPSRLSRLPGHFRTEKHSYQRLLWLSAEGRAVWTT